MAATFKVKYRNIYKLNTLLMKTLTLLTAVFLTVTLSGQITEGYLGMHYEDLQEKNMCGEIYRETPWVRRGFAQDTCNGLTFKLNLTINNDGLVYWVDAKTTTNEPISEVYRLVGVYENTYNIEFTHELYYSRKNLGMWKFYDGLERTDSFNIYEASNHDDPNKLMQIKIFASRHSIAHKADY